jgi:alkylated DNA nucleotide flippase Atl1
VINRMGKISPHGGGIGTATQHLLLEQEGVEFDTQGRTDFTRYGWLGEP